MGSLLTKNEVRRDHATTYSSTYRNTGYNEDEYNRQILRYNQQLELQRQKERLQRQQEQELISQLQRLALSAKENKVPVVQDKKEDSFQPIRIQVNSTLLQEFLQSFGNYDYLHVNNTSTYNTTLLDDDCIEFNKVKNLFRTTNKKCFSITSIHKIDNPYLLVQYKLMGKCYEQRYGHSSEEQLFHGTRKVNIDNICKFNFNWRLKGQARGHIYGQGVSFTPIANYATHYGDKTFDKVMIVANVLISNKCLGDANTVIPPINYDTTTKDTGHVVVKYEDNTFYPAYIIYYQGIDRSNQKKHTKRIFFD